MDEYVSPNASLSIALHRGLYLVITMDRYVGPHAALTIA
jgi:hypothetical protein